MLRKRREALFVLAALLAPGAARAGSLDFNISISGLTANNTSANPNYNQTNFPANFGTTSWVSQSGETIAVDPAQMDMSLNPVTPGHVSSSNVHNLIPSRPDLRWFAHVVPWFGDSSHIDIGVNDDSMAWVQAAVTDMKNRGFDGMILDWYGKGSYEDKVTLLIQQYLDSIPGNTFKFIIMMDGGIPNLSESVLETQIRYVQSQYFSDPNYELEGGQPILMFFGVDTDLGSAAMAQAKADTGGNMVWVTEGTASLSNSWDDESFDWTHDYHDGPSASDPYDLAGVASYYSNIAHSGKKAFGSMNAGFNGTLTKTVAWSKGKYTPRGSGACVVQWAAKINSVIPANVTRMQWATWDDWEEGTDIEGGVENNVTVSPTVSGGMLNWTYTSGTGDESTIDHYEIYASIDGSNAADLGSVPAGTHTFNLAAQSGFAAGTSYKIYVAAVGKAVIRDHLSQPATYNVAGGTGVAVSISPTSASVTSGATQSFTAAVTGTSNAAVTWSASAGSINSSGLFTAPTVTAATAVTVTATSVADPTKSAAAAVTVTPPVVSGQITVTSPAPGASLIDPVAIGASASYSCGVTNLQLYDNGTCLLNCGDVTGVQSISQSVNLSSSTAGTSHALAFKAWCGATVAGMTTETVTVSSVSVGISPSNATVTSGATQSFTARVTGTSNAAVTWSASAGSINSSGLFTAPTVTAATAVTVTATSVADPTKSATAAVTVTAPVISGQIVVTAPSSGASLLDPVAIAASASYSCGVTNLQLYDNGTCLLNCGDVSGVQSISQSVNLSSSTAGTSHALAFKAWCGATVAGMTTETVTVSSVSVGISPSNATVTSGATQSFTAAVTGTSNAAVTWSASAGSINSSGLFTAPAVTAATAVTVTATSVADPTKSAAAAVTVTPPVVSGQITVTSPAPGASLIDPVAIAASASYSCGVTNLQLYDNGTCLLNCGDVTGVQSISQSVNLSSSTAGTSHALAFKAWCGATVAGMTTETVMVSSVTVSVLPSVASVNSGATQPFAATVTGSANTAVTWTASAGSINASGLFTAPTVTAATTVTVTAASVADPAESATATVTVEPALSGQIAVTSPASGASLLDPVAIAASASYSCGVTNLQLYDNGTCLLNCGDVTGVQSINQNITLTGSAAGTAHTLLFKAWCGSTTAGTASETVTVLSLGVKLSLTLAPSSLLLSQSLSPASFVPGGAIVAVQSEAWNFPTAAVVQAQIALPSGIKTLSLTQSASNPDVYYDQLSSTAFSASDFFSAINGGSATVTVGTQAFSTPEELLVLPSLGAIVEDAAGQTMVALPAGSLTQEALVSISSQPVLTAVQSAALASQNLQLAGTAQQINFSSSGTFNSAFLSLTYDPSMIPAGRTTSNVGIAYFNTVTSGWEVQSGATANGVQVQAPVSHFSLYAPVVMMPNAAPVLNSAYAYPNPAIAPADPVVRACLGIVDTVDVTIYDVAGRVVNSGSVPGGSPEIVNGQYCYDYAWTASKASGVYFFVAHGKAADGSIQRARGRFAVVR